MVPPRSRCAFAFASSSSRFGLQARVRSSPSRSAALTVRDHLSFPSKPRPGSRSIARMSNAKPLLAYSALPAYDCPEPKEKFGSLRETRISVRGFGFTRGITFHYSVLSGDESAWKSSEMSRESKGGGQRTPAQIASARKAMRPPKTSQLVSVDTSSAGSGDRADRCLIGRGSPSSSRAILRIDQSE